MKLNLNKPAILWCRGKCFHEFHAALQFCNMHIFELFKCVWPFCGAGAIVRTPHPLGDGGLSHFSERVYRRDLCQIVILGGNWHFRWGWYFSGGTWKLSVWKIVNMNLKQKNDSKCGFYNFSLLLPYPNNFLVVCICTIIFHGIYSPTPTNIFFVEG